MQEMIREYGTWAGLGLFAVHLLWGLHSMSYKRDREGRLESAGTIVSGGAGLLLAGAVWVPWPWLMGVMLAAALAWMMFARALYELAVFRGEDK